MRTRAIKREEELLKMCVLQQAKEENRMCISNKFMKNMTMKFFLD